jgi:hypothetical protein
MSDASFVVTPVAIEPVRAIESARSGVCKANSVGGPGPASPDGKSDPRLGEPSISKMASQATSPSTAWHARCQDGTNESLLLRGMSFMSSLVGWFAAAQGAGAATATIILLVLMLR